MKTINWTKEQGGKYSTIISNDKVLIERMKTAYGDIKWVTYSFDHFSDFNHIDPQNTLKDAKGIVQEIVNKEEEEVNRFRCSCCDKLKDSRVKKMRKWNNGHIEVAICGTCSSKIRFHGYKTVQGFLNNN